MSLRLLRSIANMKSKSLKSLSRSYEEWLDVVDTHAMASIISSTNLTGLVLVVCNAVVAKCR